MPLHNIDWEKNAFRQPSFLCSWSVMISDALNEQLPAAEKRFVIDIACRLRLKTAEDVASFNGGPPTICIDGVETGEKYPAFAPPAPTAVTPARFSDRYGVTVTDALCGPRPAAAVLLVGADNKSDSDAALAFAVRAAALMAAGTGVVIVDVVPGPPIWATHLHSLTGVYPASRRPRGGETPILAVHPEARDHTERFVVWHFGVPAGAPLPTVPVPVCGAMHLKLDLEATYLDACKRGRFSG